MCRITVCMLEYQALCITQCRTYDLVQMKVYNYTTESLGHTFYVTCTTGTCSLCFPQVNKCEMLQSYDRTGSGFVICRVYTMWYAERLMH